MEDSIALIQPAGLGVDQVLYRPARQGSQAVPNLLGTDLQDRGGTIRIDQRGRAYLDRSADRSDGKRYPLLDRDCRSYFDRPGGCRKTLPFRMDQIYSLG